jgi:hypothetical protein
LPRSCFGEGCFIAGGLLYSRGEAPAILPEPIWTTSHIWDETGKLDADLR